MHDHTSINRLKTLVVTNENSETWTGSQLGHGSSYMDTRTMKLPPTHYIDYIHDCNRPIITSPHYIHDCNHPIITSPHYIHDCTRPIITSPHYIHDCTRPIITSPHYIDYIHEIGRAHV